MQVNARALIATALLSAGALLLEIALARVLSVILVQSYVFLILSVAVLGMGIGAALAVLFSGLRAVNRLSLWLGLAAVSTVVLAVLIVMLVGYASWFLFVLAGIPYFFLGLVLAALFTWFSARSPLFYAFDLVGAGLAVVLSVPLLNWLGGLNGVLLAAVLLALAALVLSRSRRLATAVTILVLLIYLTQVFAPFMKLDMQRLSVAKPILEQFNTGAEIRKTRWDAFARTDLLYRADQDAYYLYIDGGAGSVVPDKSRPELWSRDIGSFPFFTDKPRSALLIGAGGGLDVALAQEAAVPDITVIEVNRASIDLVKELEPYAASLYAPPVTVLADEGRSALRRKQKSYDLIFLSQVMTQASEARGLVLAENKLYTTEAFYDYLNRLNNKGQIALKLYDELTLTRAFFTAVQTLAGTGLSEAEATRHLLALLDTRVNPPIPLLIIKKEAIDPDEAVRLARAAEERGYALLFIPGLLANPPLDALADGQINLKTIIKNATGVDLRPVSDDRPFFYQFAKGLPSFLQRLGWGLVALGGFGLIGWLALRSRLEPFLRPFPLVFALLGFGFMALEISLLQRTQLLLGHPTLALSLTLGVLLVGSGLGSLIAARLFKTRQRQGIWFASGMVVILWLAWTFLWPVLETNLQAQTVLARALLTGISILPIALFLGMPFPLSLRLVGERGMRQVAIAWSVNGVTSVMGSVAATSLALVFGFQSVVWVVALSYILVVLLTAFPGQAKIS